MPSIKTIINHNVEIDLAHNLLVLWALLVVLPLSSGILVFGIFPLLNW